MRLYIEELEGLFESLMEYYKSMLRLEERLRIIAEKGDGRGLLEMIRWRMTIARLLVEHKRLLTSVKEGSYIKARNEACATHDIAARLLREPADPTITFYAKPLLAEIYEITRVICELQSS